MLPSRASRNLLLLKTLYQNFLSIVVVAMLPPWFLSAALIFAAAGPVSHGEIWVRGEWDGVFHKLVPWILSTQALGYLFLCWLGQGLLQSLYILTLLNVSYLVSLFASIAIYRLFLHPTRGFPGPFWARLSSWWRVRTFLNHNEQAYAVTHELHQKYGDIVRAGTFSKFVCEQSSPLVNLVYRPTLSLRQPCGCNSCNIWTRFQMYQICQLYVDVARPPTNTSGS